MADKIDRRQLPLNALRTFETTGRLLNMRLAAQELGVTHGAVSHQIRSLEERLGISLFVREHNKLNFTPHGQRYYQELHSIFEQLVQATRALDLQSLAGTLTVGCSTDTAANWLVPALGSFLQQYPEIQLKLVEQLPGDEIDPAIEVGILSGIPKTEIYQAEVLTGFKLYPVCAPSLLIGAASTVKTQDILNYRLLHCDQGQAWNEWLSKVGLVTGTGAESANNHLYLPNVFNTLTAARQGLGIALAQDLEVADDLASGALIKLSEHYLIATDQYYLISLKDSLISDRARVFTRWVRGLIKS